MRVINRNTKLIHHIESAKGVCLYVHINLSLKVIKQHCGATEPYMIKLLIV